MAASDVMAADTVELAPGGRLANGAVVVAVRTWRTADPDARVFLALYRDELVTWIGNADGTGTTWGHYFLADVVAAVEDWQTR